MREQLSRKRMRKAAFVLLVFYCLYAANFSTHDLSEIYRRLDGEQYQGVVEPEMAIEEQQTSPVAAEDAPQETSPVAAEDAPPETSPVAAEEAPQETSPVAADISPQETSPAAADVSSQEPPPPVVSSNDGLPPICMINPTQPVGPNDSPVFISSFPGSGARMIWKIVEALTGKPTGDEWDSNGLGKNVIGVNTHWPHPTHGHKLSWGDEIEKVIVFIRNPMHVLPAFHNYIYAATVLSTEGDDVEKIAPESTWYKWRDSNFNQQLLFWRVNTQYWLDKYSPENRVVTPYERLVDYTDGPKFTQELNQFLNPKKSQNSLLEQEGVVESTETGIRDPDEVQCIWAKVMEQEDSDLEQYVPRVEKTTQTSPERSLLRSRYDSDSDDKEIIREYTKEQYNQMIVIVRNLRVKYGNEPRLDNTLRLYDEQLKRARDGQKYNDLYVQ